MGGGGAVVAGGALPADRPPETGKVDARVGTDDAVVAMLVVVGPGTEGSGGFDDAGFGLGRGLGGTTRGGAPVATAVSPLTLAVAPDAGTVVPSEAMIERNPEMLKPATRTRVAAAGWRRRRHAEPPSTADCGAPTFCAPNFCAPNF